MSFYLLRADSNNYQNIVLKNKEDWDLIAKFDGRSLSSLWKKVEAKLVANDKELKLLPGDFPSLVTHVPVFSQRALTKLKDSLKGNGEALPLVCDEGEYFAFNVTNIVDALDEQRSEIKRFKSSNRIMEVVKYRFHDEKLSANIFKIPQTAAMDVFVSDKFKKSIESFNLKGFEFRAIK